jgi:hypothetical protein
MRRLAFLLLTISLPTISAAEDALFDGPQAVERYYELRGTCRMAEAPDGRELSEEEWDRICNLRDELGNQLRENGYCWDSSEVVWYVCEPQAS